MLKQLLFGYIAVDSVSKPTTYVILVRYWCHSHETGFECIFSDTHMFGIPAKPFF